MTVDRMEAVLFVGIQASGKTSFYRERFFTTHLRLSLDMLRTRHRLHLLMAACIEAKQPFVLDNTNATADERARYIAIARAAGFHIAGYFLEPDVQACLRRNAERDARERVPVKGIFGTAKRLQAPSLAEGFDALYVVRIETSGRFMVKEWADEVREP